MKSEHERILSRLWQVANLTPEQTKGNMTAQLKALEMILQVLDALEAKPATTAKVAPFYRAAWMDLPTPDRKM